MDIYLRLVLSRGADSGNLRQLWGLNMLYVQYYWSGHSDCTLDVEIEGQKIGLSLWDTAGQEDYDRLRPLSYPQTDIFLICFSVDRQESFENIEFKWLPEISHFCLGVPFILICCKADLRDDQTTRDVLKRQGRKFISSEEGEKMSRRIRSRAYLECSAKTQEGVNHVFRTAATIAITPISETKSKPKSCILL
jgi:Ras family protein A